jgi:hypothetical protein
MTSAPGLTAARRRRSSATAATRPRTITTGELRGRLAPLRDWHSSLVSRLARAWLPELGICVDWLLGLALLNSARVSVGSSVRPGSSMLVTRLDRAPELGTRVGWLVGAAWEFDAGLACRSSMAALLNSARVSVGSSARPWSSMLVSRLDRALTSARVSTRSSARPGSSTLVLRVGRAWLRS